MITDKLGKEIKAGSWIVYGHAIGRSAGLRIGKVLEVKAGAPATARWNRKDQITVWGMDDDNADYYEYNQGDDWARPRPLTKRSALLFGSRCVVISKSQVPAEFVKQIEEASNSFGV